MERNQVVFLIHTLLLIHRNVTRMLTPDAFTLNTSSNGGLGWCVGDRVFGAIVLLRDRTAVPGCAGLF